MNMNVYNMQSPAGNPVPNQIVVEGLTPGNKMFKSYDTIIAKIVGEQLYLDAEAWNYSRTTAKYRNIFTGLTTDETKAGIKNGTIKLINLN